MNKPNKIVIHHSATPDNKTLSSFNAIRNYHMNKGWRDIGYHFIIEYVDGKVITREGRDVKDSGAHTIGHNSSSIGICIVGNFDKETPTNDVYKEVAKLCKKFNLPVYPHNKFANKSCPGKNFDMNKLKHFIEDKPKKIDKEYGVITASVLNVRKGRGTNYAIIGKLKRGEKVRIGVLVGDWYNIYYGSHGGWIHKDYVDVK